jgi:hypothetical protein
VAVTLLNRKLIARSAKLRQRRQKIGHPAWECGHQLKTKNMAFTRSRSGDREYGHFGKCHSSAIE